MTFEIKPLKKPEPPHPDECCGRGCVPCVFDYYETQLEKWQEAVKQKQDGNSI